MKELAYPALDERLYQSTLPNGLRVLVLPRKGISRKLAYLVTDFGAIHTRFTMDGVAYEMPAGIAHYLEHKMFELPGRDVSAEFAALGANPNAFTSYDMTAYYFTCTEHFDENLRLLLEFVSTPYFTPESVAKEQGIIGQEIGMNEDNPDTRVFENLMTGLYAVHPIRVPILGTRETIAEITPALLEACHRAFYDPSNLLLCVTGDVDPERVEQIAGQVLPARSGVSVCREEGWEEPMTAPVPDRQERMDVAMPTFQLGFKCKPAPKGAASIRQELVGDLAAEALFGESSALYLRLYEQGLIDSSFSGGFESVDSLAMLVCGGDSDDPAAVRDAILEEAARLAREGVPEADFLRMKKSALGRRMKELDSLDSVCFRLCAYALCDFNYLEFPGIYQDIQRQELAQLLEAAVAPAQSSLSVILPRKEN